MRKIEYYYDKSGDTELILTQGQAHSYPWHMHTRHCTAGLVRHGSVRLITDTSSWQLHAGQPFFIRPYEPHSLCVETESALLVVCFRARGVLSTHENLVPLPHTPFLHTNEITWIEKTIATCTKNIFLNELDKPHLTASDSLLIRSIQEVMWLIMKHPAEELHSDQMALYAGYSQWYFLRAFQKVMRMTPHAFQLLCRLRLLRSLLRSDTASSTAAVSAGFTDQSHMHKVFKRHHGMTPGEFKKFSFRADDF